MINKKYLKILDTLGKEKQDVKENPDDKILIIDGLNTFIRVFSIYIFTKVYNFNFNWI